MVVHLSYFKIIIYWSIKARTSLYHHCVQERSGEVYQKWYNIRWYYHRILYHFWSILKSGSYSGIVFAFKARAATKRSKTGSRNQTLNYKEVENRILYHFWSILKGGSYCGIDFFALKACAATGRSKTGSRNQCSQTIESRTRITQAL